jgi:class 3 adenylate cyclase
LANSGQQGTGGADRLPGVAHDRPAGLPTGTVAFLFTDIEGSTRLLQELGSERYGAELELHRQRVRGAIAAHGGVELGTEGDAIFVAFARASDALSAAGEVQTALVDGPIRVRIGIHTGEPLIVAGNGSNLRCGAWRSGARLTDDARSRREWVARPR